MVGCTQTMWCAVGRGRVRVIDFRMIAQRRRGKETGAVLICWCVSGTMERIEN